MIALLSNANAQELAADSHRLQEWAEGLKASRDPDYVIGGNYLLRWFVVPRNVFGGVYLHEFRRSDDDVLHDHPWDNTTVVVSGRYFEVMPDGSKHLRRAGDIVHRMAEDAHRVELIDDEPTTSLFMMGPRRRQWGFHCPNGWVQWDRFVERRDNGNTRGMGCGED